MDKGLSRAELEGILGVYRTKILVPLLGHGKITNYLITNLNNLVLQKLEGLEAVILEGQIYNRIDESTKRYRYKLTPKFAEEIIEITSNNIKYPLIQAEILKMLFEAAVQDKEYVSYREMMQRLSLNGVTKPKNNKEGVGSLYSTIRSLQRKLKKYNESTKAKKHGLALEVERRYGKGCKLRCYSFPK